MRKPFVGVSLGGAAPATTHGNEIWMSWFESNSSETKADHSAVDADPPALESNLLDVNGGDDHNPNQRQDVALKQRRLAMRERLLNGQDEAPPPLPSMAIWGSQPAAPNQRPTESAERQEPQRASYRLPVIDRVTMLEETNSATAKLKGSGDAKGNGDTRATSLPEPVASIPRDNKSSGAFAKLYLERSAVTSGEHSSIQPLPITPINRAEASSKNTSDAGGLDRSTVQRATVPRNSGEHPIFEKLNHFKKTGEISRPQIERPIDFNRETVEIPVNREAVLQLRARAAAEAVSPFGLSESIRGPESNSSQVLAQKGLYNKFVECHEHISWGPDGSVSVALKSDDGYRRTIVCRTDGTSFQRITDPQGQEILRFSSDSLIAK